MKSIIKNAYRRARSIFTGKHDHRYASCGKSNTAAKMDAEKLAADHWRYVEGVLLRHGVPGGDVEDIGVAYRAGFIRGWGMAGHFAGFGLQATSFCDSEWRRWCVLDHYDRKMHEHFREAFVHGWKHRMEVVGWPRGRYDGQKIVGFWVKFKLSVDFWDLSAGWNFGQPYLHIGPFHFWFGVEYRRTMHK